MIDLTWKSTLSVLAVFFALVWFVPAPECVQRANFKVGDSAVFSVEGSYCVERRWISLHSLYAERAKD